MKSGFRKGCDAKCTQTSLFCFRKECDIKCYFFVIEKIADDVNDNLNVIKRDMCEQRAVCAL